MKNGNGDDRNMTKMEKIYSRLVLNKVGQITVNQ